MSKLFKSRHLPYKLFSKLLYKERNGPSERVYVVGRVEVPEIAKSLRCSNQRVIEALDYLSALRMVSYNVMDKKSVFICLILPSLPENKNEKS